MIKAEQVNSILTSTYSKTWLKKNNIYLLKGEMSRRGVPIKYLDSFNVLKNQ